MFRKMSFIAIIVLSLSSSAWAQKTEYASDARKVNIRVGPLGLLLGYLNADVDFKVGQEWTAGPSIGYLRWNLEAGGVKYSATAFQLGLRTNWYFQGTAINDGWYFGPGLTYSKATVESNEYEATAMGLIASGIVGYNWMWENFNIMLGGGMFLSTIPGEVEVTRKSNGVKEKVSVGRGPSGITAEFTLGWAF